MLLVNRDGKGTKKVPLSRCVTPDTGWEVIKLSTRGSELYIKPIGIKMPTAKVGELSRLYQMLRTAKMQVSFETAKKSGDFLFLRFQPYYRYYSNGINSFVS